MKLYTYLALGDSYTIGEKVKVNESFPYQTFYNLRNNGIAIAAPEIVATSGFTTDELNTAIEKATLLKQYDFVSLLIGVNNQYRGKSIDDFARDFESLIKRAIQFAGGKNEAVFALSIPDWGVTPYAATRDTQKISAEIDSYNQVCEFVALKYHTVFIEITAVQRKNSNLPEYFATDQLHPSGKEYSNWAALLGKRILALTK